MPANATSFGSPFLAGQIAFSLLSLALLIFTSVLSYFSYSAQARTGIRESLEQIDDVEINNRYKLKPILHRFDFGPLNPNSTLLIKVYQTQYNESVASIPENATDQLDEEEIETIVENVLEDSEFRELLGDSYLRKDGVYFELDTRNAVAIRRFANKAMEEIRDVWVK